MLLGRNDRKRVWVPFVSALVVGGWLAGCSGALFSEGLDASTDAGATDATNPPPMCPDPAEVRRNAACDWTGPACPSLESPWPPECGDRGGPRAQCSCFSGSWVCGQLAIACVDAAPPIVDAGPAVDAPPCPPPEQIRNNGACSPSFLSCPSVENKRPACIGGYEPTTCHCLSREWSCEVYGIACPDAGREGGDAAPPDVIRPDVVGPDVIDAARSLDSAAVLCDGSVCADAADDAPEETAP